MKELLTIFVVGIGGVFLNMAILYASIRLTSWGVDLLDRDVKETNSP